MDHESSWNYQAANASSGAYGLVQALPGSKMASAGADWQTNPATQIKWGLNYMNEPLRQPLWRLVVLAGQPLVLELGAGLRPLNLREAPHRPTVRGFVAVYGRSRDELRGECWQSETGEEGQIMSQAARVARPGRAPD